MHVLPPVLPTLRGDRVHLRPPHGGDRDALFALYSAPAVMRYWSTPAWSELAAADAWFGRSDDGLLAGSAVTWAICRPLDDRLIGTVSLHAIFPAQARAEIGYALHPAHWGCGLAREAVRLALGFGFDSLGLRRIEADTDPENAASCRLLEALGFAREGLLRERWQVGDTPSDTAFYGLLKGDLR
ncbi:MAG: GNAT family N-acetyltransferase [Proteobacteria bacterium]|nr:GNAT family N-acetyltransferase [Pseudomonadota bacterium]MBS0464057.1 GNAT family N-acetyltransferase [Pseudomonadota bacterium]